MLAAYRAHDAGMMAWPEHGIAVIEGPAEPLTTILYLLCLLDPAIILLRD